MRGILPGILSLLLIAPLVLGAPAPADNPVVNGDFSSPFMPDSVKDALQGTPVDECIGLGHQANFGTDTWQEDAYQAVSALAAGDPENATDHAGDAAGRWAGDPVYETMFFSGYSYCEWGEEDGYDYAWIHPHDMLTKPGGWSRDIRDPSVEFGYNLPGDTDPFNRAAMFTAGEGAGINLWQSYASAHQAWSGNHGSFGFDLLSGEITGSVQIILNTAPLETMGTWVVLDTDCSLTYSKGHLAENAENGRVSVDPVDATFRSRHANCDEAFADWEQADGDEKREILGRLRMVQLTFWNWNSGDSDVVIDNVEMSGTTLFVEEAAAGNQNHG